MANSFSRNLALLRQEKGLSQRKVASDLGVSQALLSHYENGVREPGLDFVIRVSAYYGVATDFLLGSTMSRDGTTISVEDIHNSANDKDNRMGGASVLAILRKKLLVNSVGVIFDILGKTGNAELINQAFNYLAAAVYKIFRYVYEGMGTAPDSFFLSPAHTFPRGIDADMALSEMALDEEMRSFTEKNDRLMKLYPGNENFELFKRISHDTIARDYPLLLQSLLTLLHHSEDRIVKTTDSERVSR